MKAELVPMSKVKIPKDRLPVRVSEELRANIRGVGQLVPIVLNQRFVLKDDLQRFLILKDLGYPSIQAYIIEEATCSPLPRWS